MRVEEWWLDSAEVHQWNITNKLVDMWHLKDRCGGKMGLSMELIDVDNFHIPVYVTQRRLNIKWRC